MYKKSGFPKNEFTGEYRFSDGIDPFTADMLHKRDRSMADPLRRRHSLPIESIAGNILGEMKLLPGLRRQTIFNTWYRISGAEAYTVNLGFNDGILFVTMSSSVVRTQLSFQLDWILSAINQALAEDKVFISLYGGDASNAVKKIVLR